MAFSGNVPALAAARASGSSSVAVGFTTDDSIIADGAFCFPLPMTRCPALRLSVNGNTADRILGAGTLSTGHGRHCAAAVALSRMSKDMPAAIRDMSRMTSTLGRAGSISITSITSARADPAISVPGGDAPTRGIDVSFRGVSAAGTITVGRRDANANNATTPRGILMSMPRLSATPGFRVSLPSSAMALTTGNRATACSRMATAATTGALILNGKVAIGALGMGTNGMEIGDNTGMATVDHRDNGASAIVVCGRRNTRLPGLSNGSTFRMISTTMTSLRGITGGNKACALTASLAKSFAVSTAGRIVVGLGNRGVAGGSNSAFAMGGSDGLAVGKGNAISGMDRKGTYVCGGNAMVLGNKACVEDGRGNRGSRDSNNGDCCGVLGRNRVAVGPGIRVSRGKRCSSVVTGKCCSCAGAGPQGKCMDNAGRRGPSLVVGNNAFTKNLGAVGGSSKTQLIVGSNAFAGVSRTAMRGRRIARVGKNAFGAANSTRCIISGRNRGNTTGSLKRVAVDNKALGNGVCIINTNTSLTIANNAFSSPSTLLCLDNGTGIGVHLGKSTAYGNFGARDKRSMRLSLGGRILALTGPAINSTNARAGDYRLLGNSAIAVGGKALTDSGSGVVVRGCYGLALSTVAIEKLGTLCMLDGGYNGVLVGGAAVGTKANTCTFSIYNCSACASKIGMAIGNADVVGNGIRLSGDAKGARPVRLGVRNNAFGNGLIISSSVASTSSVVGIANAPSFGKAN